MPGKTVLIVLDGVGVGDAPDAAAYGDSGSNSLGNTARQLGGMALPHMGRLGLGHLTAIPGTPPAAQPQGGYGRVQEVSAGKDSTTGHWEICGIVTPEAFPVYPAGFPAPVIRAFEEAIGRPVLGNRAASGTEIIQELGDAHARSGRPIVYTSADSVFQVAAHEDVVPLQDLYDWCAIARAQLQGPHRVGRVIARPFTGTSGAYRRTPRRRDYAVPTPTPSLLTLLQERGHQVVGIGKIEDLFSGAGLTDVDHTTDNDAGMQATSRWYADSSAGSLVFTNLNDFDTLWGHRNDAGAYAAGLQRFDAWLGPFLTQLAPGDLLVVTSDHGNDPTTPGTDHSRELLPLLAKLGGRERGVPLGTRRGLMDVAATILEHAGHPERLGGCSFRRQLEVS